MEKKNLKKKLENENSKENEKNIENKKIEKNDNAFIEWCKNVKEKILDFGESNKENEKKQFNFDFNFIEHTEKIKKLSINLKNKIINSYSIPKKILNKYFRIQLEKILLKILNKQPDNIKNLLIDEYMFDFAKNFINDLVDEFWPEIEDEILFLFRLQFHKPIMNEKKENNKKSIFCLSYIRNFFLYTLYPHDKSFWKLIRSFKYWILNIIISFPFFGLQQVFYLILFLMKDKSDEYQLIQFILNFKKLHFLSMGIFSSFIAYLFYFKCINFDKNFEVNKNFDCIDNGPQKFIFIFIDISGFLIQIILIWISYLLVLFYSKPKEKPRFQFINSHIKTRNLKKKRLNLFMFFELLNNLIIITLFIYFYYFLDFNNDNSLKNTIYFIKVIYGFLSFPFFIFIIPDFIILFTNSRETLYDKQRNCVPLIYNFQKEHKKNLKNKFYKKWEDFEMIDEQELTNIK